MRERRDESEKWGGVRDKGKRRGEFVETET